MLLRRAGPELPDYVRLRRKAVKYARIRIQADATVELTVPDSYRQRDIAELLQRKAEWIAEKRHLCLERLADGLMFEPQLLLWQDRLYQLQFHARGQDRFVEGPTPVLYTRHPLDQPEARRQWYRKQAKSLLDGRLQHLAQHHDLTYSRISVRDQKTRWGSCSSRGTISLNWRLVLAPEAVADYVMLHELAHTRHMNHSPAFWQLLERLCPDHKQARAWLKEKGQGLMVYL